MLSHHEKNKQSELFHLYTDCSAKLGKINEPHLYHYQDCAFVYLVLWGPHGLKRAHGKPCNTNYLYLCLYKWNNNKIIPVIFNQYSMTNGDLKYSLKWKRKRIQQCSSNTLSPLQSWSPSQFVPRRVRSASWPYRSLKKELLRMASLGGQSLSATWGQHVACYS